jgi:hypothetical protein
LWRPTTSRDSLASKGTQSKQKDKRSQMEPQFSKSEGLVEPLTQSKTDHLCCFDQCQRKHGKTCFGRPIYIWKNRFDSILSFFAGLVILSLFVGLIIPLVFYELEVAGIRDSVVISSKDSVSYDIWQSNFYGSGTKPIIHYDIYIFDLQNPVEALNGSQPVVVEKGPYAFHEYYNKFDIYWKDDGNIVHYKTQRFYVFDAERTGPGLHPTDEITIPYATVVGFNYLLSTIPVETQQMLDYVLETQINAKVAGINAQIDAQEEAIRNNPNLTPAEKANQIGQLEIARQLVGQVEAVCFGVHCVGPHSSVSLCRVSMPILSQLVLDRLC